MPNKGNSLLLSYFEPIMPFFSGVGLGVLSVFIFLLALRILAPNAFYRVSKSIQRITGVLFGLFFIPDFGAPMLAKQIIELKGELERIRSSASGAVEHGQIEGGSASTPSKDLVALINVKLQDAVSAMSLAELLEIERSLALSSEKQEIQSELDFALDLELNSMRTTKNIMLNVFILINLGLIAALAFFGKNFSESAFQALTALYVSLAVFIVYVYRTANSRILIVLATKEDAKRLFEVNRYLSSRPKSVTTERDVDVVRLLLTNRMERERGSEHPYELVLKGVTNSNVLVKGGKVTSATKT